MRIERILAAEIEDRVGKVENVMSLDDVMNFDKIHRAQKKARENATIFDSVSDKQNETFKHNKEISGSLDKDLNDLYKSI